MIFSAMKNLELHHFKAFNNIKPIVLDNPDAKNILLYGENGAGKSSLFEALRYAFYKDIIEQVDPLLPMAERIAAIDAIRVGYNSKQSVTPFSLKINGADVDTFSTNDYQAFFLNRFDQMDCISIKDILSHLPLPISDINSFMEESNQIIVNEVNDKLDKFFHEPYKVAAGVRMAGYPLTIENTATGLSRNVELHKFFNEAIINLVQLLVWFESIQLMFEGNKKKLLVLDDFITSLDAANRIYLVKYLISTFSNVQIIVLTHDYSFFNIVCYIIQQIELQEKKWMFFKLYLFADEHRLETVHKTKIKDLRDEYNTPGCNLDSLGNKIRKCFEEELHELAARLTVGNMEETCDIINRIGQNKDIYWKHKSSVHNLVSEIEDILASSPNSQAKNEINKKIKKYKLENVGILKDTINHLKLYQKVAMHPLSHGVLGTPHYQQKDVEQSLLLLEKLDGCLNSMIDGKI